MSEFNLKDRIKGWDRKELVKFCLFCCYKVKHSMNEESLKAVELVEKWLEDKSSVSKEELRRVAYAAACTTVNAAAAYVAYNTASAAAYHAIEAAYYAAYIAYYASKAINSSEEDLYLEFMRGELSNIMEN